MPNQVAADALEDAARVDDLPRAARAAARTATRRLGEPASLVLAFISRGWSETLPEDVVTAIASSLAVASPEACVVVTESSGALASTGEREGRHAVSVLALARSSVRARVSALPRGTPQRQHTAWFERAVTEPLEGRAPRVSIALLSMASYTPETLVGLGRVARPPVVGGGVTSAAWASPGEAPEPCDAVVISLAASLSVAVVASPAAKLLTPWLPLEKLEGSFLLRAGGEAMLDLLTRVVDSSGRKDPLFIALRPPTELAPPLLRAVVGVDPKKGAVGINDVLPQGAEIALAARDAEAARADHAARLAAVARGLAGGVPAASLMLTCAGRGAALFGQPDGDVSTFRARFPGVPFAGMHSSFELAPWGEGARVHLFTAVSVLFYRPS